MQSSTEVVKRNGNGAVLVSITERGRCVYYVLALDSTFYFESSEDAFILKNHDPDILPFSGFGVVAGQDGVSAAAARRADVSARTTTAHFITTTTAATTEPTAGL